MPLPCFSQQLLSRVALPGVRKVGSGRWPHIDVGVAVFAHQLPRTAEDPHEQGFLRSTSGLLQSMRADFHQLGGEFDADQIAGGEERVPIPLFVDVMSRHCGLDGRSWLVWVCDLVSRTLVGGAVLTWAYLAGKPGGTRVAQARPHNRFAAFATARGHGALRHSDADGSTVAAATASACTAAASSGAATSTRPAS